MNDTTYVSFPGLGIPTFEMKKNVVDSLFGTGLSIAWYGLLITIGIVLAGVVILHNARKKEGYETESFLDYFLWAIPLSVVGARLMHVAFTFGDYITYNADGSFSLGATLKKAVALWEGGLAVYGGVIFGAITVILVAKKKKHNPFQALDAIMPGLLLAQAIGRWGNFVNGECYGVETSLPWGISINFRDPVHPLFFYESLWNLIGFALVMLWIYRAGKKKFHGEILCFYMIWYGAGRTVVEALRNEDLLYLGPESWGLRVSMLIGILSAVAGIALLFVFRKKYPVSAPINAEAEEKAESVNASETAEETEKEAELAEKKAEGEERSEAETPEENEAEEAEESKGEGEEEKNGDPS